MLFNDRVLTYFIALHPRLNNGTSISTADFLNKTELADFKALSEIFFPAFVFAYYRPEFRNEVLAEYSYRQDWVQQKITQDRGGNLSLIKTMQQVQAAGGISRVPSEGELMEYLYNRLKQGIW